MVCLSFSKNEPCDHGHAFCTIRSSGKANKSFVPPLIKPEVRSRFARDESTEKPEEAGPQLTLFKVTYQEDMPNEAKDAVNYALLLWQELITSTVPIVVNVSWRAQGDDGALASAGPSYYLLENSVYDIPQHYCPISIKNRIKHVDQLPLRRDIAVTINSDNDFYFGTDGDCPITQHDLVSIVLHEIGHGLGFTSTAKKAEKDVTADSVFLRGALGWDEKIGSPFDYFIEDGYEQKLMNSDVYENPSRKIFEAFVGNNLYFGGTLSKAANDGKHVPIFAPRKWDDGSSISHLNEASYLGGDPNSLMTPQINMGEVIHSPGLITLAILGDMGWNHLWINHVPNKDTEDLETPIRIIAGIQSDSALTEDPTLNFRYAQDQNYSKTPMAFDPESGLFYSDIKLNGTEVDIDYFIQATGSENRVYTNPSDSVESPYTIHTGTDLTAPTIAHTPVEYIFSNQKELILLYQADDNMQLGLLETEMWFDNIPIDSISYIPQGETVFFTQPTFGNITSFQAFQYRFVATDSAAAQNKTYLPAEGVFSLRIEPIYAPVTHYTNGFTVDDPDFILDGFTVGLVDGFADATLGTPHPYANNGFAIEYYAYLRQQIIVQPGTTLSFDEVVLVEPGEDGVQYPSNDFYDFVTIQASKDQGKTWFSIAGGWDSTANSDWKKAYNDNMDGSNSTTVGTPALFKNRLISFDESENLLPNDIIMIRFYLHSDPNAVGWGWAIDNLTIAVQ